jgi:hypothetical protein
MFLLNGVLVEATIGACAASAEVAYMSSLSPPVGIDLFVQEAINMAAPKIKTELLRFIIFLDKKVYLIIYS